MWQEEEQAGVWTKLGKILAGKGEEPEAAVTSCRRSGLEDTVVQKLNSVMVELVLDIILKEELEKLKLNFLRDLVAQARKLRMKILGTNTVFYMVWSSRIFVYAVYLTQNSHPTPSMH
jgi:hypothetical protein